MVIGDKKKKRLLLQLFLVALLIFVIFWVNSYAVDHDFLRVVVQKFGYVGVFFGAAVSGFNLIVPIPIITFLPFFVEIGLNFYVLIFLIAFGMTVGDSIGYLIGKTGRGVFYSKPSRLQKKIDSLSSKHKLLPYIVLFFYAAFAPIPNEVLVIPMAFSGFRFRYMFISLLLGNIIFNVIAGVGILTLF